jgi:hypothetical protein
VSDTHGVGSGQLGTLPGEGLKPTTLQKLAGLRNEPPMSLPSAIGTIPHAKATAAPLLLPPHVARLGRIVGVEGLAEDLVVGLRAGTEFGSVGLADGDRSGLLQSLDHQRVYFGDEVFEERRAEGSADALCLG